MCSRCVRHHKVNGSYPALKTVLCNSGLRRLVYHTCHFEVIKTQSSRSLPHRQIHSLPQHLETKQPESGGTSLTWAILVQSEPYPCSKTLQDKRVRLNNLHMIQAAGKKIMRDSGRIAAERSRIEENNFKFNIQLRPCLFCLPRPDSR